MSDKMREALKLARKAMRECGDALTAANIDGCPTYDDAMDAIDAALAEQPAQGEAVCHYCDGDRQIETDNNGPIVPCPVCTPAPSVPDGVAEAARYFKAQGGHIGGLGVSRAANILWDYINDVLAAAPEVKS